MYTCWPLLSPPMNGISRLSFDRVKNETERDTSSLHDGSANVRAGFRRRLICHATLILNAPAARTPALGGAERRGEARLGSGTDRNTVFQFC